MAVTANQVQSLYVAYFGRPAEPAGLTYWTSQTGATVDQVSAAFAQQTEYTSTYGGLTRSQTVSQLYQNLFGRSAAADELNYWVNSGDITVDRMALALVNGASGTDRLLLESKVQYASALTSSASSTATVASLNTAFDTPATAVVINGASYSSLANYLGSAASGITGTSTAAQIATATSTYLGAATTAQNAVTSPVFAAAGATAANGGLLNGQTAISGTPTVDFGSKTAATIGLNAVDADATITLLGTQATSLAVTGTVAASTAAVAAGAGGTPAAVPAGQVDLAFTAAAATTQFNTLNLGLTSNGTTDATKFVGVNVTGLTELTSIDASGSSASLLVSGNTASANLATITLGSGADTITASTSATGAVAQTVNAGAGNDTITATAINAALTINGGAGNDNITANVTSSSAANLVVNAGEGNDLVTVNANVSTSTAAHTASITLGAGNDTLAIGSTLTNVGSIDLSTATGITAANTLINANLVKVTDFSSNDVLDVTVGSTTLANTYAALNLTQAANATGAASLAEAASVAVAAAHANAASSTTTSFQFGGNTYVAVSADATFGSGDGLIELTGYTGALTAGTNLV
ncbi:DUF4214 domain-containing protein [Pseudomonas sp. LA5]|uniref:DUF4214 domain-containing protein n=1 Tax=Pseudomonas sp. LA5 TaxID=3027850 RepID=UPI00235F86EF|nr:DUF4214 domain-containing protein [Pseudomonas sp. LA5]